MADALHSHQSQQDGNEARSGAASVSTSASILSAGELLPAVADETSAMFLQPPTISFTPATPSPPLPTPHEGLDDSVIQGLLSGGVNSLNSPPLGKAALIDPPDPLSLPGVSEGLLKVDSGGNAELSDVSESSLDTLSSIVNSTSLSFREISAVAECLEQPGEVPSSSASVTDSQNQQEASSKDVEKSPTVPPTDSLGKEVDGTSEPVRDLMSVNEEVEKALEPSLETIPPKELDASDWKHSFGSGGEGTNCSNGDVQDPKTNDEGHSLLPTEEPAIGTEGLELGAKEPPSPLSEFSAEFAAESQQENCLGSGSSNSEIALPLEMQNSSEDSYSLLNSTITDSSKGALTNPPSECKDVSGTDDVGKSNYLCDGDAANLSSITGNESLLSQIQDSSGRPEAMEVDEENVVQKFDELEKALEVMADMPDSSEVLSSKENSLPNFADLKDGVNKTGGDDGKEVGIVKKVSSLLLNDAEEPLQPVTIGGSLQPLEEVQEASILNDPSFTADLSLIESSADEADSIGGLVINSVIGAADGVADFPPDDEMETERQLMDISSSAPRVNHGVCEVDASEDIEPSAKRRKLENGEKEDDVLVDARSVTFKVLPVKNGHGLWDSIKLKEILLSKGTLHLRIHASSNDLETFEPEKCEIEVDFTCIMVSALEEECDSALGNSTQDPEVFDPLAIGATIGAVESNSPPHYPRPFGAQTRGRSTALQPAMPRPPYRQLQSPPHAYNKNEVLGLAQGIEFEETPGTTEWSDLSSLRSPSQEKPDFQEDSNSNSTSNQDQEQAKVNASTSKVKVCEHCGRTFEKTPAYLQHIISHRPVQQCKWCTFKSKDEKRFAQHTKSHLEVQCNICLGLFATPRTKRIHKKRIHKLYECKTCTADFTTEEEHADHLIREHSGLENRIKVEPTENETNGGTWSDVQNGGPETQEFPEPKEEKPLRKQKVKVQEAESLQKFTCYLCNEETQNKCELKIHIAQHLGVPSSKITDEDLLMGDMKPYNFSSESSQYNGKEDGLEVLGSDNPMQLMLQDLVMSNKSKLPYSNLTSPFSLNIIPQSFHSARRQDSLLGSTPTSRASGLRIKEEPGEMGPGKNEAFYDDDADFRNDDVSDDTKVSNRRTTRYSYVRRIPCDQCDAVFKSYNKLRQHEKQKHREKPTCPLCNTSRTNVKKVFQHQIAAHKNKLRCHYLCLALFDTKEEQSAHHLQVHNKDDSKLTCRYCKESYLRATFMDHLNVCEEQHVRKESPENSHACGFCETSFQTLEEYTNHIKFCGPWNKKGKEVVLNDNEPPEMPMVLRERNPTVDNTEITDDFSEDNSIDRGTLNVNAISVKVKEEICQDEETRHSPVFIKQEGMKHKCKHCSLTFEYQEDGINHVLAHHKTTLTAMTREPQMCHVCGKTFLSSLAFCKHILNHYSELGMWDSLIPPDIDMETIRNTCWICKTGGMTNHRYHAARRDNTIESLLATSSADPDGEPFNCSMCDETFPDRMLFWKHIRLHLSKSHFKNVEGGKRLKCSKCPMKFKKKSELHQHLAAHLIHSDMEEVASESENSDDDDSDSTPKSSRKRPRRDSGKRTSSCSLGVRLLSNSQPPMRRHFQKCKRCRKKFANKEEAVDHVQKYHKSVLENMVAETQICHICDKAFRKPMLLCRHLLHHYRELSMWDDLVPRNILDVSQDRRFCWICNNMLGRKASRHLNMRNTQIEQILMSNSKKLREEPEFSCTLCDATCSDRHAFWKHINLHFYKYPKKKPAIEQPVYVSTETLDCNECLLKFKDKTDLNKHMASHFLLPVVQEEDFKEENCKVKEESEEEEDEDEEEEDEDEESTAKAHSAEATSNSLRKGDPQEGMKCTRCLKVFQKTSEAVQHMMSSHKFFLMRKLEISEMCHLCGSIFKSQWCLCKHVCKHYCTLEMWDALVPKDLLEKFEYRNYCWICKCKLGRKYAHHIGKRNFNIEKILKTACTEDQEQDFVCNVCKIRFPNRLDFWMHIKTHICKPPIKAGRLGKTFASASDANSRQLKVLECSECSEKFFEEHDLYKHLASHYIKPVSKEMDVADDEEVKSEEVKGEIKNEADQEEQRATRYKRKRRQLGKKSLESREEGVPTDGRKDKGVKSLSDISLSEEEWVPSPHEEEEEGEEDDEEDADGGEEPENSNVVRGESEMSDVRKDSGNDNFSKKNVEDGTGDCDDDDDDDEEEGEDEEMEEEEEEEEEDMNEDMEDEELLGDEIEEEEEDADDELEETGEEVESDLEEEEDDEEDSDY